MSWYWWLLILVISCTITSIITLIVDKLKIFKRVSKYHVDHEKLLANSITDMHIDIELANIVDELDKFMDNNDLEILIVHLPKLILMNDYFLESSVKILNDYNLTLGIDQFQDDDIEGTINFYKPKRNESEENIEQSRSL